MADVHSSRYRAIARYDDDCLGWKISVEGVPGFAEECTRSSIEDAARWHVARALGVPSEQVAIDLRVEETSDT